MNNVFALSNDPSKSAFQPLKEDEYDLLRNTRTPTTITFKSSKAITNSKESIDSKKEANLEQSSSNQTNRETNLTDFYLDEKSSRKVKTKVDRQAIEELDPVSSNSEPLPFQDYLDDCTSRSNSNCSNQSLFSDELSCSLTFNSTAATVTKNPLIDLTSRLDSSIDSTSLYNKHLLFKIDKDSPQLLIGGSQLPGGVCCVLSNKPVNSPLKDSNDNQIRLSRFARLNETIMSPDQDSKQDDLELLELPKRTKRKHKSRLKNQTSSIFNQQINHPTPHTQLTNQQLNDLLFANQEQQKQQLNASNENKPQFRFTRYDTVDTEDGGNHVNLLAIDHLPNQMIFQDNTEIANLNQARLIKTNLLKQKFAKNTATSQPTTNNQLPNQLPSNLTNLNNLPGNFAFLSKNKLGLIINQQQQQQPNCNCNELNKEINNNSLKKQTDVCVDCENAKKILQSNLVQLIPLSANQSCSTTNSNTSPLSIQISPLSAASSAQSRSTCSGGQLNSISNQNVALQSAKFNNLANIASINQQPPPPSQAILASIASNQGNVFNYDPATIHQYAISLNQQQQNFNNNLQQERTLSSLSGFSDPITQQINSNLGTARSASSCAQYNLSSMQEPFDQITNQVQPINPNFSRSEQNLISSSANNRFYNSINNDNFVNNQMPNQRQPFYSQQQIYDNTPNTQFQTITNLDNQMTNQMNNQMNNQQTITTNRPYRHLSFRTPSPTLVTSSSLADSALESPSTSYVDNNQDSVNIFNTYSKYQSSSNYFNSSYFYTGPKEHNFFRKAVPTLPIVLAVLLCILNWFLPGSGTLLSSIAVLIGCRTEHGPNKWKMAFFLNLLAGLLQFLTAIIVIGWVWSVMWGTYLVKQSISRRSKEYTAALYV